MNNSFLKRHESSIHSAELLIAKPNIYYNSSIHCSYYAVYQLILYILKVNKPNYHKNRDRLDNPGSHERAISETFDLIFEIDTSAARQFSNEMGQLKNNRVVADYKEDHIDWTRSNEVLKLARRLIRLLADVFKIKLPHEGIQ